MKTFNLALAVTFILAVVALAWRVIHLQKQQGRRRAFIEGYAFPAALRAKLHFRRPELSENQVFHVFEGLRQYFLICLQAGAVRGRRSLGMPSRIVDDAWHEFILMSREYSRFCDQAFGAYLHHTPAEASDEPAEKGVLRTLHQLKGGRRGMAWATLGGIPLLFALDRAMAIEGGQHYDAAAMEELERKRLAWQQAGGDISITAGDLGSSCNGSSDGGGGSDGGSCGSGCGGGCGS